MAEIQRELPLADRRFANAAVSIEPAPPADRMILRVSQKHLNAVSGALGTALPRKPKTSASKKGLSMLWLGPDEWLILTEAGGDPASKLVSLSSADFSAVDVSHRNTAIMLNGPGVEATLAAGCPQNLSIDAFPPGACSRTILGKAEIILYRQSSHSFRVECWRSFADYVWQFLVDAAKSV